MIVNVHKRDQSTIVAVCDENLMGQCYEEGDKILDLSSSFYAGERMTEQEAGDFVRNAHAVNLVGEKSVALGIVEGVIDETKVLHIQGIPYALGAVDH
ncbi:DUF424 family protein [Candidatus Woesearchaeota archaeon]|nr:DUF424 family protein [Candidatus Woesearchaeota archaeon]